MFSFGYLVLQVYFIELTTGERTWWDHVFPQFHTQTERLSESSVWGSEDEQLKII